jgi:hypothetical protein
MMKNMVLGSVFIFLMGCTHSNSIDSVKTNTERKQKSINQRLPDLCGFGTLYYGKVKYDKASKIYYLTVKDRVTQNTIEEFELDQTISPQISNKYILFYGNQLLGGNRAVIEGEVLHVVDNHRIDFEKIKAWCALQPNDSSEPKVPKYRDFHYRGDE